jgi:hypothetical protein
MSASLLAELAAIETIMTERAVQMEKKQQQVLPSSQGLEQSLTVVDEAATTPPTAIIEEGVEVDRDHTCAVCLVSFAISLLASGTCLFSRRVTSYYFSRFL